MKFVILFLLVSAMQVTAGVYSQEAKVTLQVENASFESVIRLLEKSTDYTFLYEDRHVEGVQHLNLHYEDVDIKEVLDACLKGTSLTYKLINRTIIIQRAAVVAADTLKKITVKGIVKDEKGEILPGVTIRVQGTTLGFVTNLKGEFDFDLPKRDSLELIFSFVGFQQQKVQVKSDMKPLTIVMKEDVQAVEEVVITGIFNKPKESFTGAVTSISKAELKANYSRNLLQTLSNLDPSFHIVQNNKAGSDPNALPEIQLRGASSLANVSDLQLATRAELNLPLFILDGFEVSLQRVQDLNNEDIENITILKDAGATALYGSRGANGVVVITSVVPKAGGLRVSYRGALRLEIPDLSTYDLLNAKEKMDLEDRLDAWDNANYQDMYKELREKVANGLNYDWLDLPVRTGVGQTHSLSFMGGSETWRFSASLAYDSNVGVMKGSERNNFNGNLNVTYQGKKLLVTESLSIGTNNNSDSPFGSYANFANMNPYWTPFDENGELIEVYHHPLESSADGKENPAYNYFKGEWNKSKYTNIRNSTNIRYNLSTSFYLVGMLGLSRNIQQADRFSPPSHKQFYGKEVDQKGRYNRTETETNSWDVRLNANFAKTFNDKHMVTLMASVNMDEKNIEKLVWSATGFTSDNIDNMSTALGYENGSHPSGENTKTRNMSLLFSGNYYYDSRYFIDFNVNANGSSSFGSESRWAPFYSVGLGWNVSKEAFFMNNVSFISWLKVKASYGVSGTRGFDPLESMSIYYYDMQEDYMSRYGAYLSKFGNSSLKWQNTYQLNTSLELRTLQDRLEINVTYYNKRTTNTLADVLLPISHGFDTSKANTGVIRNRGYELKLTYHILEQSKHGVQWNIIGSFTGQKNTIVELSDGYKKTLQELNSAMYSADTYYRYREGHSMDAIYGLRTVGVDPGTGQRLFLTKDGEVTFAQRAEDMVYLGNNIPKINGTLSTDFAYKGIILTVGFAVRWGGKQFNSTLASKTENSALMLNQDRRVLKGTWQQPGDVVPYKKLALNNTSSNTYPCDAFVQKDNVFSCTNINLTYNFPASFCKQIRINGLSVNANLSDIFYISSIKRERGTSYPFSRNPNFSISCTF